MYLSRERFNPAPIGVNSTIVIAGSDIGGFLCLVAGTLTITRTNGTVVVNAVPVTAGQWLPLPFYIGIDGGTATTAGGASGVLGV